MRCCLMRSSARASAARRFSRQWAVRFCGRSGMVSRVRSVSAIRSRRATSEARSDGIPSRYGGQGTMRKGRCFSVNATFRHYQRGGRRRPVIPSVLSIMRSFILALSFGFSLLHPAVAGGPVEKMLGFFDRLRQAGTEQAAHRPVPHVETRFTEGEVNDYMVYALKTTPRPGVKSIHVEFTDGNYMATTVVADLDALERWKPGTPRGALPRSHPLSRPARVRKSRSPSCLAVGAPSWRAAARRGWRIRVRCARGRRGRSCRRRRGKSCRWGRHSG